ncbi:unannotated protein [freshwater metagenome]|uniref:Unannotated protein n=1 Tax=freshwater metagenome TaxID=449393 RepID=A0A6J6X0M2_9ZZZZ
MRVAPARRNVCAINASGAAAPKATISFLSLLTIRATALATRGVGKRIFALSRITMTP